LGIRMLVLLLIGSIFFLSFALLGSLQGKTLG
jgi:hypothetical protein